MADTRSLPNVLAAGCWARLAAGAAKPSAAVAKPFARLVRCSFEPARGGDGLEQDNGLLAPGAAGR
eukprot:8237081-Lingulodinium_polyedra.AAC.1